MIKKIAGLLIVCGVYLVIVGDATQDWLYACVTLGIALVLIIGIIWLVD